MEYELKKFHFPGGAKPRVWGRLIFCGCVGRWAAELASADWYAGVPVRERPTVRNRVAGLGEWKAALGWPVFLSASIATGNAWGLATGEWRNMAPRPRRLMLTGASLLIAAYNLNSHAA